MSKVVSFRTASDDEIVMAQAFQDLTKLSLEFFSGKAGAPKSQKDLKKFRKEVKRFSNYPFARKMQKLADRIGKDLGTKFQAKRPSVRKSNTQELIALGERLAAALVSGKPDVVAADRALELANQVRNAGTDLELAHYRDPHHLEDPMIFSRPGFLQQFDHEMMEALVNKDLSKFKYTYLTLPSDKMGDFTYMVHWINELSDSSEDKELSNKEFTAYSEFAYSGEAFDKIKSLVDRYLHGNSKKLIPEILKAMSDVPDIEKTNEAAKKKITTVYRGVPLADQDDEDDPESYRIRPAYDVDDVLERDLEQRYVATSTSRHSARNFALQKGHLTSDEGRRSKEGVIIEYSVTPDSIVLDTSIFGGLFGESEVIIIPRKASYEGHEVV